MPAKRVLALFILLLAVAGSTAEAVTTAHFVARRVDNVCAVDDSEPILSGDPDLRFRMVIKDIPGLIFCGSGCESVDRCGFVSACGTWDFADVELTKVIPDSSAGNFYFHLIDDDTDEDDYMGGWSKSVASDLSAQEWNNRLRSNDPSSVCGEGVEGDGWVNNYRLTYSVWFTDSDGPTPLAAPIALENGYPTTVDYDQRLDFSWTPTDDPNTGVQHRFTLLDVNTGSYVFQNFHPLAKNPVIISVCASGCSYAYVPVAGHQYLFMVSATNGVYPGITNPTTVESPFVSVVESGDPLGVEDGPAAFFLAAPSPNPTDGRAMFAYSLPAAGPARLEVMDLQGRHVTLLADGAHAAGPHRITWNGRHHSGQSVKPGAYWVRLRFANTHKLQRLVVVR